MAFITARLQRRFGAVWASVMVAPCFGFIHFPLLFISGGVMDGRPHGLQLVEYIVFLLILFSVPVRLIVTWVFNSTRGSLPVVALMHSSFDTTASTAVLNAFFPRVDGLWLYVGLMVVAAVVIVATRGRLGYRPVAAETVQSLLPRPTPT